MALYEMRTYTLRVGTMAEAVKLYQELGYPALQKGVHDKHLIGYFQADTGTINQLVHLWKFEGRRRSSCPLGGGLCQRGFRAGIRREVPAACGDPRGQAVAGRTVGTASLTGG